MTSKLFQISPHEPENQIEVSLREDFNLLEPKLRPPFPLTIPSPSEYSQLNRAIVYGILTEPKFTQVHFTHLNAIVTDGYQFFVNFILKLVFEFYPKFLEPVKVNLIWVTSKLVEVSAMGIDNLLVCLMRQIVSSDFSDGNLWLAKELIKIFLDKFEYLLEEEPLVLTSALFNYLRLLAYHYRFLSGNPKLEELKRLEIDFCVRILRKHFHLCLRIGRDLVRLLQDLVYIPEFRAIWKDLLLNPVEFRTLGFSDIKQLYCLRTSSRYFLLRISPEMETQLRFLLTHVRWGYQRRYQEWFARKFFSRPESEIVICDIVRFICCAHHPPNEIIQSDVISRWAIIGWLLKCCRKNYVEANTKLALFYDWLFFDERMDNIMNIEPGILLMVNSIPRYIDMTHSLLEFLLLLVDNYDVARKNIIIQGVSTAFLVLVKKGVVRSLEALTSCSLLSPLLKERLAYLFSDSKSKALEHKQAASLPHCSVQPMNLPSPSDAESQKSLLTGVKKLKCTRENLSVATIVDASSVQPLNLPSPTNAESQISLLTGVRNLKRPRENLSLATTVDASSVQPLNLPSPSNAESQRPSLTYVRRLKRPRENSSLTTTVAASSVQPLNLPSPSDAESQKSILTGVRKLKLPRENLSLATTVDASSVQSLNLPSSFDAGSQKSLLTGVGNLKYPRENLCLTTAVDTSSAQPLNSPSPPDAESQKSVLMSTLIHPRENVCLTNKVGASSVQPLNSPSPSDAESQKSLLTSGRTLKCPIENASLTTMVDVSFPVLDNLLASPSQPAIANRTSISIIEELIQTLGDNVKRSNQMGLRTLEEILFLFANLDKDLLDTSVAGDCVLHPEVLASRITEAFKSNGYEMFVPLRGTHEFNCDDEIQSATALITCTFIFCQHKRLQEMILFWSRNGYPVGPRLLSYASRLFYEARVMSCLRNSMDEETSVKISISEMPLLKHHIDRYTSFLSAQEKDSLGIDVSASKLDAKLLVDVVEGAFASYRSLLTLINLSHREHDTALSKLVHSDLLSCCGWETKRLTSIFSSIFSHLSDLCTAKEEFILLLLEKLDHVDLVSFQFEISLKRFSMFGENTKIISHLIKCSLKWGILEQHKFWDLMASELAVSKVCVEKVVMDCLLIFDPSVHPIAVGGLLALCNRCRPTPELVGTMMSFPDNTFGAFAAAVLASWVVSNGSLLFNSIAECLEKFQNKDTDSLFSDSTGVRINNSTVLELLSFLEKQEMKSTDYVNDVFVNIPAIKAKLVDAVVVQSNR